MTQHWLMVGYLVYLIFASFAGSFASVAVNRITGNFKGWRGEKIWNTAMFYCISIAGALVVAAPIIYLHRNFIRVQLYELLVVVVFVWSMMADDKTTQLNQTLNWQKLNLLKISAPYVFLGVTLWTLNVVIFICLQYFLGTFEALYPISGIIGGIPVYLIARKMFENAGDEIKKKKLWIHGNLLPFIMVVLLLGLLMYVLLGFPLTSTLTWIEFGQWSHPEMILFWGILVSVKLFDWSLSALIAADEILYPGGSRHAAFSWAYILATAVSFTALATVNIVLHQIGVL